MRVSLYAGLSLGGALLMTASVFFWLQAGERVFVDRLLAGIAGCF